MPDWVYKPDAAPPTTQPPSLEHFPFPPLPFLLPLGMNGDSFPPSGDSFGNNLFFDPFFQQQQYVAFDGENSYQEAGGDGEDGEIYEDVDEEEEVNGPVAAAAQAGFQLDGAQNGGGDGGTEYNPAQPLLVPLSRPVRSQLPVQPSVFDRPQDITQTSAKSKDNPKPPLVSKAAIEERAKDLRAKLLASKRTATPAVESGKSSPAVAASSTKASAPPSGAPKLTTETALQNAPKAAPAKPTSIDVDELLRQGKAAAAAAEKNRNAKPPAPLSTRNVPQAHPLPTYTPLGTAVSDTKTKPIDRANQVSPKSRPLKAAPKTTPKKGGPQPPQAATASQHKPQQKPQERRASSSVPQPKSQQNSQERPPSRSNGVREGPPDKIKGLSKPATSPNSAQGQEQERPRIDTALHREGSRSIYYTDLDEWLDYTGFHDVEYRQHLLSVSRKRQRLMNQLADLEKEEELGRTQFRSSSVMPSSELTRGRSASKMPPPPPPRKYSNGNANGSAPSTQQTPVHTPLSSVSSDVSNGRSELKRPRADSDTGGRSRDGPPEKQARTEHSDRPSYRPEPVRAYSPARSYYRRSLSPRERRTAGGDEEPYPFYHNKSARFDGGGRAPVYDRDGYWHDSYHPSDPGEARGKPSHRGRSDRGGRRAR